MRGRRPFAQGVRARFDCRGMLARALHGVILAEAVGAVQRTMVRGN